MKILLTILILILSFVYTALPVLAALNTTSADLETDSSETNFTVADSADLDITSSFTFEMWLNWESTTPLMRLFDKATITVGTGGYGAYWNTDNTISIKVNDGSNNCELGRGHTPTTGTWYHFAAVFDDTANVIRHYINGSQVGADQTCNFAPSNTAQFLSIGSHADRGNSFDGKMDDVRLYNVARTGAAIAADYQQQLVGNETGLVGYWMLNNGAGTCGTTQLEDKGETTDPVGAVADDLTNVNSVQCVTDVPFTNAGAAAAVVPKRRLNVIIIE